MEDAGFVGALVGVGAEVVALGLEQVGGQAGGAVAIVVGERGAEGGDGDAVLDGGLETAVRQLAWVLVMMSRKYGSSMRFFRAGSRGRRR